MVKLHKHREVKAELFTLTPEEITMDNFGEVMLRLDYGDSVVWYRARNDGWGCPLPRASVDELETAYAILKASGE